MTTGAELIVIENKPYPGLNGRQMVKYLVTIDQHIRLEQNE